MCALITVTKLGGASGGGAPSAEQLTGVTTAVREYAETAPSSVTEKKYGQQVRQPYQVVGSSTPPVSRQSPLDGHVTVLRHAVGVIKLHLPTCWC